ncbi:hypothetical protein ACJJTC_013737 [Scirpophaga incertulas]
MAKVNIPTVKLNNGIDMPALGYGTWLGLDEKMNFISKDVPKLIDSLSYAIDVGYRHIDTAHVYRVEPEIGAVINKKIKEGVVTREDMFVVTKVWQHCHRKADVEASVRGSLRRLNLDYVDLVLMHWPMSISVNGVDEKIDYLETWSGFEAVLEKGLVKSIGVSNFNIDQLKRLLANCKVPPVCLQVEINVNLMQKELVALCNANNIAVVAYSPFGTMVPGKNYPQSPEPKLNNVNMMEIAKKHNKTVTQVVLRYLYQNDIVSLPKTITKTRVLENASIFDFNLDEKDMKTIAEFDNGFRAVCPVFFQDFQNYPFDKIPNFSMPLPQGMLKWKNGANENID